MKQAFLCAIVACGMMILPRPLWAVKGESWKHDEPGEFSGADADNVVVSSRGEVTLSRRADAVLVPGTEAEVINALARASDGRIYAASGPKGLIYRIDGDRVTTFAQLPDGGTIFSLLFTREGRLLAGTGGGPQARIYQLDAEGRATVFFQPPETRYVWAMARGGGGEIYAATGVEGRLFVIEADGSRGRVLADLKPKNLLCLAFGHDGFLYTGTDEDGLICRVNPGNGQTYVMYDAREPEISALVVDAAGNIFAATAGAEGARPGRTVADAPSGKPEPAPAGPGATNPARPDAETDTQPTTAPATAPTRPDGDEDRQRAPVPALGTPRQPGRTVGTATRGAEGGNAIYRIDIDGFVTEVFREPVMILALAEAEGVLFAATGNEGRIYTIQPQEERTTVIARLKVDQATALLHLPGGELVLGTANPAMLVRLSSSYAPRGTLTSKPLDAGQIVKWGRMQWKARVPEGTRLTIATRSGNVADEQSDAWEEWSPEADATTPQQVASAGARFLQYRLTFESTRPQATPVLRELEIFRIEENRAPQITDLKVLPAGEAAKDPNSPSKVKALASAGMGEGDGDARADTQWVIMWKAEDPNRDSLRYEVFFREEGAGRWIRIDKDLKENYRIWDTLTVPDGRYEVRVTASDLMSNSPGTELSAARISDAFLIDNTPPEATIGAVTPEGRSRVTINATFTDALSNIAEAAYTLNSAEPWIPLSALDDVFDSPVESVSFALDGLTPGEHRLALRVRDRRNNTRYLTRAITIAE